MYNEDNFGFLHIHIDGDSDGWEKFMESLGAKPVAPPIPKPASAVHVYPMGEPSSHIWHLNYSYENPVPNNPKS